jgi:hypothetical protein
MDLIDRYLYAVRGFLPGSSQDDIIRELAEDIRAQKSDREEELGRPLTADDEAALLKQFGHPMLLAARYRRSQQLISPVVFPYYWLALKIAGSIALAVQMAMAVAMVVNGQPGGQVIGRLAAFPFTGLVTLFGWMTIAFAIVDLNVRHITSRLPGSWDPRTLAEPPRELLPKNAWSAGVELVVSTVFLGWWLAIPQNPFLVFGPAAAFLSMAPAWKAMHMTIAVLWLASLAVRWTLLFRPGMRRLRLAFDIGANVVGLVVAAILLKAEAIVTLAPGFDPGAHAADLSRLVHVIDTSFRIAVWICTTVWEIAKAARRRIDS